jgi:hypothetical protein
MEPAPINPAAFRLQADIERQSRRGGNIPEARSGDISQSQGSAAFVNSLMGGMSANIRAIQLVGEVVIRGANEAYQALDRTYCDSRKSIAGYAQGAAFRVSYKPSEDIPEGEYGNIVTYGEAAGLDAFNAELRLYQRVGSGLVSKAYARENLKGVDQATREAQRVEAEQALEILRQGVAQQMLAGNGTPFAEFWRAVNDNMSPLEAVEAIVAAMQPVNAPQGQGAPPPDAMGQALALEKGALPQDPANTGPPVPSYEAFAV